MSVRESRTLSAKATSTTSTSPEEDRLPLDLRNLMQALVSRQRSVTGKHGRETDILTSGTPPPRPSHFPGSVSPRTTNPPDDRNQVQAVEGLNALSTNVLIRENTEQATAQYHRAVAILGLNSETLSVREIRIGPSPKSVLRLRPETNTIDAHSSKHAPPVCWGRGG